MVVSVTASTTQGKPLNKEELGKKNIIRGGARNVLLSEKFKSCINIT